MVVNLLPHQIEPVEKLSTGKILWGGVGSGKTITALYYFLVNVCGGEPGKHGSVRNPKHLYVFTTARKRDSLDWETEAAEFGIYTRGSDSIGEIQLHVDSWNNIGKYKEIKNAFFIFDEQRVIGSGAWTKAFLKIAKNNDWIVLSGTPGDVWLDYIPIFIANGFYKNRTEFIRDHVITRPYVKFFQVERYIGTPKLVKLRNQILVHMPYERHTTRHIKRVIVDFDKELFKEVLVNRWHVYENRPLKNVSELFAVMRRVVNSDLTRLEAVSELVRNHPRLIVFYNFDYELEILRSLDPSHTYTPPPTYKKPMMKPSDFRSGGLLSG